MIKPSKMSTNRFDPTKLNPEMIIERLQSASAKAGKRGNLPIDDFVAKELVEIRKLSAALPSQQCPFHLARQSVVIALETAHRRHNFVLEYKMPLIDALSYLKHHIPKLDTAITTALRKLEKVQECTDEVRVTLSKVDDAYEGLSLASTLLYKAAPVCNALHIQLSQQTADVWRNTFIVSLFPAWWLLSGRDPKPKEGPFQRFVIACWCSLSDKATPTDWAWESAISVALKQAKRKGWWRLAVLSDHGWTMPAEGQA